MANKSKRTSVMSSLWGVFLKEQTPEEYAQTVIVGLCFLRQDMSINTLREVVKDTLLSEHLPRYQSRVVLRRTTVYMEPTEEELDMDYHVSYAFDDPEKAVSLSEAYKFIEDQYDFENRMDLDKPLWRFKYIPRLEDGRSLAVLFVNHVLGDGMSQLAMFLNMTDKTGDEAEEEKKIKKKREPPSYSFRRRAEIWLNALYQASGFAPSKKDDHNQLSTTTTKRVTGVASPTPLAKIKEISQCLDGKYTVNDILMTVLNLSIVTFLKKYDANGILDLDEDGNPKKVSATFPIDLRPKGFDFEKEGTGNVVSSGGLTFVLNYENRLALLSQLKNTFDDYKISPQPVMGKFMHEYVWKSILSDDAYKALLRGLYTHNTAMLSNVFGPTKEVSIAGVPVDEMQFFAFSKLALYFGILSYDGSVNACFVMDAAVDPGPEALAACWNEEFEELYKEAQQYQATKN